MTTASVFTGIKLSNESRSLLLDRTREAFGEVLPEVKAQHITIKFRGSPDRISEAVMGQMVEWPVSYLIFREGVQVAVLGATPGILADVEFASLPHITVAVEGGVKASYSKKVARDYRVSAKIGPNGPEFDAPEGVHIVSTPLVLHGQVGFVHDRHGWVFTHLSNEEMAPTPRAS